MLTAWRLPDNSLMTAWWLYEDFLTTARHDCITFWWLPDDCLTSAWRLLDDYLKTWRLLHNCRINFALNENAHAWNVKIESLLSKMSILIDQIDALFYSERRNPWGCGDRSPPILSWYINPFSVMGRRGQITPTTWTCPHQFFWHSGTPVSYFLSGSFSYLLPCQKNSEDLSIGKKKMVA